MLNVNINKIIQGESVNASFSFGEGIFTVMGESGIGKTTLLNMLAGIIPPDSGIIELDGAVLYSSDSKINIKTSQRCIGYMFQDLLLFPNMTVYENIKFPQEAQGKVDEVFIDRLMDEFKITHLKDKHPKSISGGEKQRCALARALSAKPKLLLIDEGFSALDSKTKEYVISSFIQIVNSLQITAVVVTHNISEAEALGSKTYTLERKCI